MPEMYYLTLFWSMLLFITSPTGTEPKSPINVTREQDSLSLVVLYDATNGSAWNQSWDLSMPMSQWYGVTLSNNRVSRLNLTNNGIKGRFPEELADLEFLQYLHLAQNDMTGTLPANIDNLSRLEEFQLDDNRIGGGIPNALGFIGSLRILSMKNNQLVGSIPSSLGNLSLVQRIDLSDNRLTGSIPAELTQLNLLEILDLSANNLSGSIPGSINNLSLIREIYFHENELNGSIPQGIVNCHNLIHLWLHENALTGAVPDVSFLDLNSCRLENNELSELPDLSSMRSFGFAEPFGLKIEGNKFSFEDLIPMKELPRIYHYSYLPQDTIVYTEDILYLDEGSNFVVDLDLDKGIPDNNYKWFRDTSFVLLSNLSTFDFINAMAVDEGHYSCRITNIELPDLELHVAPFRVIVNDISRCNNPVPEVSCNTNIYYCHIGEFDRFCASLPIVDSTTVLSYVCDKNDRSDNPRWMSFRANTDSIALEIIPLNCTYNTVNGVDYIGLQAAVWDGCDTSVAVSLDCQSECVTDPFILSSDQFVPGNIYYVVVDGCEGSLCDFSVRILTDKSTYKVASPDSIIGEKTYCSDSLPHLFYLENALPTVNTYEWYINDSLLGSFRDSFCHLTNLNAGQHILSVRGANDCDTSEFYFDTILVHPPLAFMRAEIISDSAMGIYHVELDLAGGKPPYAHRSGAGNLDTASWTFVSAQRSCQTTYEFIFSDANGCEIVFAGKESCGCIAAAGMMANDTIVVCGNNRFTVNFLGGEVIGPDDDHVFLLHSDPNDPVQSLLKRSRSGVFAYDPQNFRVDSFYFITHAVGLEDMNGDVDLEHPCTDFSNSETVVFRKIPIVSAGGDKTFCGLSGELQSGGNYQFGTWILISGPGQAIFADSSADFTQVSVDTLGEYIFERQVMNAYCPNADRVKLTFQDQISVEIQGDTLVCNRQPVILDAGPGYVQYLWDRGDSTRTISVDTAGVYCVTVVDPNNCVARNCLTVRQSEIHQVNIIGEDANCQGRPIELNVSSSYAGYMWSTGSMDSSIVATQSGNYCVTVTNGEGCSSMACKPITIGQHRFYDLYDSVCVGEKVYVGTDSFHLPGDYRIDFPGGTVNGCDSTVLLHLFQYSLIRILDLQIQPDKGGGNGSVVVTFQGGTQPYKYLWSNGARTPFISNLSSDNYEVVVTDANGCQAVFQFFVPLENKVIDISEKKLTLEVLPNPGRADGKLFFRLSETVNNAQLVIFDAHGKIFYKEHYPRISQRALIQIEMPLPAGFYYLGFLEENGRRSSASFIIQ